jgi:CheY-like chemotaxis protein
VNKKGKTILLADDDPAILDVMSAILEDAGYRVETSSNGEVRLDGELPDLYLLDLWMSVKDGRDTCKEIKKGTKTKHIPVIIVSANKDIEKIALESGADAFLAKPFEMDELLSLIAKYI